MRSDSLVGNAAYTKSMDNRTFFLQLGFLSLLVGLGVFFLNKLPKLQDHALLSWSSLAFFILLSILMYFIGKRNALSENKNDFTNVVLGFTMGKMFISAILIYLYIQLVEPEGKLFILPFFGIYLFYTVFETYFMMRLGKTKV